MANYVAIRLYDKDGKIAVPQDCWPVGSIYISVNNVNPTKYFGGTWVAFGTGRTLVGVDTNQTEFNSVEKTGGAKTHTLIIDEMPKHSFRIPHVAFYDDCTWSGGGGGFTQTRTGMAQEGHADSVNNSGWHNMAIGSNSPHNNLQPYITVYFWKRTA